MKRTDHDATAATRPPIQTSGQLFSGGESIELIRDAKTGSLNLLLFDGKNCTAASRVEYDGQPYVPPDLNPSISRAVTLPTKWIDYQSTNELFALVRESFTNHDVPDKVALLSTYFSFSTWFLKCLPVGPCLSITGPRPEANVLLQLLACSVRHSLPLGEVTRAGFCSLSTDLQPTLLIDQEYLSPSAWRLLVASNNRGTYIPWKGGLVNTCCAKAVYCGSAPGNGHFSDGALQINLSPSWGRLPVLDAKTQQEIAGELQARLLAYYCRNVAKVRESQFDLPGFDSGIRILARVWGAPIIGAPELQADLIGLLQVHQEKIRTERWVDLRCVVIEAMLFHCHSEKKNRVHVGEITETARIILEGRSVTPPSDPKEFGGIVRLLGFSPKRDSKGWAIRLTDEVRREVHRLARDYDVGAVQEGVALCEYCLEILGTGGVRIQGGPTPKEGE